MGCYRTILVALDGSRDADAALRHAVTLARDQHARLILLAVVPPPPPHLVTVGGAVVPAELQTYFTRLLRETAAALPDDVGVETRLVHGAPARHILQVARDCRCDLIVMGFHGHGRLHSALLGSVSRTVLADGRLPVLLMRAAEPEGEPEPKPAGEPDVTAGAI